LVERPASRKSSRRVTSADVARRAGVSEGTVSHVLSGARQVSPDTRAAVELAIKELGFRPSGLGRALARNSAAAVGMLLPDITNPFFAELSLLVEQELAQRDFALLVANTSGDPKVEQLYLEDFVQRGLDGVLLIPAAGSDAAFVTDISRTTPIVLIDRSLDGWGGDVVGSDNEAGARQIAAHLSALGHRSVAHLGVDESISTARARGDALRKALADAGMQIVAETTGSFDLSEASSRAREILSQGASFTALVAANDLLALSAAFVALHRSLSIPGDLSVVGFDDIPFSELTTPSLTTVRQPRQLIAAEAVRLLMERIDGINRPAQQIRLMPELIARGSTGPATT